MFVYRFFLFFFADSWNASRLLNVRTFCNNDDCDDDDDDGCDRTQAQQQTV